MAMTLSGLVQADTFTQSAQSVARFEFVEVTLRLTQPVAGNPLTDAALEAEFTAGSGSHAKVKDTEDWGLLLERQGR